jgi:hypothetical protein
VVKWSHGVGTPSSMHQLAQIIAFLHLRMCHNFTHIIHIPIYV